MFWKDELAYQILSRPMVKKEWLDSLTDTFPSLRVKTIDVNGRVPVIQVSGRGEWWKPNEWALNHLANLKQQHSELHQRLIKVGSDPAQLGDCLEQLENLDSSTPSDPVAYWKLLSSARVLRNNYAIAIEQLARVARGEEPDEMIVQDAAKMLTEDLLRALVV